MAVTSAMAAPPVRLVRRQDGGGAGSVWRLAAVHLGQAAQHEHGHVVRGRGRGGAHEVARHRRRGGGPVQAGQQRPELDGLVAALDQPVAVDDERVARAQPLHALVEHLLLQDPHRQRPLSQVHHLAAGPPDRRVPVAGVHVAEAARMLLQAGVEQRDEQPGVASHQRVGRALDPGRRVDAPGRRPQAGAQRRHDQPRADALAHHVGHDEVEAVVVAGHPVVEVAGHVPGRQARAGQLVAAQVGGRAGEQLPLDLGGALDLPAALRHVLDDRDEAHRQAIGVADHRAQHRDVDDGVVTVEQPALQLEAARRAGPQVGVRVRHGPPVVLVDQLEEGAAGEPGGRAAEHRGEAGVGREQTPARVEPADADRRLLDQDLALGGRAREPDGERLRLDHRHRPLGPAAVEPHRRAAGEVRDDDRQGDGQRYVRQDDLPASQPRVGDRVLVPADEAGEPEQQVAGHPADVDHVGAAVGADGREVGVRAVAEREADQAGADHQQRRVEVPRGGDGREDDRHRDDVRGRVVDAEGEGERVRAARRPHRVENGQPAHQQDRERHDAAVEDQADPRRQHGPAAEQEHGRDAQRRAGHVQMSASDGNGAWMPSTSS